MPGPDVASVLRQHRLDPPPALSGHGSALRDTLQNAMAKDPNVRPPHARAFLDNLEEAANRRFGAGWLSRASVAGLVGGGGVGEGILQAGAGSGAATVAAPPVIAQALDEEPGPVSGENSASAAPASPRRRGRTLVVTGGVLVLAGAAAVTTLRVWGLTETRARRRPRRHLPRRSPPEKFDRCTDSPRHGAMETAQRHDCHHLRRLR